MSISSILLIFKSEIAVPIGDFTTKEAFIFNGVTAMFPLILN